MRPFELLPLLFDVAFLLFLAANRSRWIGLLPWASAVFLAIHLLVEGYRWQMAPAYVFTFIVLLLGIRRLIHPPAATGSQALRRILTVAFCVVGGVIAIAPPLLVPVFRFPPLDGPFQVGTVTRYVVDRTSTGTFGAEPPGPRDLAFQVWYPTESTSAKKAVYVEHAETIMPIVAATLGLPPFSLQHFNLVHGNAQQDAPVRLAETPYPVLVFLAGRGGIRQQNTFLTEQLASHGYVVVAVDQPYAAAAVMFPDGHVETGDLKNWPSLSADPVLYRREMSARISFLAHDVSIVLDQLSKLNADDPVIGKAMDLNRIGILGAFAGRGDRDAGLSAR